MTTSQDDPSNPRALSRSGDQADAARWSLATRLAFRFCFLYLGLFTVLEFLTFPLSLLLNWPSSLALMVGSQPPFRTVVFWTAEHVFHLPKPRAPVVSEIDGTLWVQAFCILVVAIVGTVLWSVFDRRRVSYPRLHAWFRLFVRVCLGATMFYYGTGKLVPAQMWFPRLDQLLERLGDFSPMAVLWASMGASRSYEFFTGLVEATGGLLLFVPGTTLLGALICAAAMTNVLW